MNRHNLQRMADFLKTVPQEKFNMEYFRKENSDLGSKDCKSVGCAIGWCTVLDDEENIPRDVDGDIIFDKWSEKFTGLDPELEEWDWCFSLIWSEVDNTPIGASKRIQWLLDHGLPENWEDQKEGEAPLCYQ